MKRILMRLDVYKRQPFTLWRLTAFDLVYAMTSGGPGEDTSLIAYRITTEAFTNLNVG